jgi:hypothetical protein
MEIEVKINYDNDELYCVDCKARVNLGDKFIVVRDVDALNEEFYTIYHPECIPETDDTFINPT